jgi:T4 RnlA family RNA ligase
MIPTALLLEMIDLGFVIKNKHPTEELYIYNYTQKTQFERVWNEITLACRGLILDENHNIVARPFAKFFNLGEFENQEIPNLKFDVFEKMDGSLGILYFHNNQAFMASRGSFNSDQSIKANELLNSKYAHCLVKLDQTKTYLFEIIYPENRIVLDYGDEESLVLLAIIDTQTGAEFPLEDLGFPVVKKHDGIHAIQELKALELSDKEGFVIQYSNNYRLKIKFSEYLRLHRIITQVSSINIWEYLKTEQPLDEILEKVPDEFFDWVKNTKNKLISEFQEIENQCKKDYKVLETEKETALYFMMCQYPSILFSMMKNRNYKPDIWKRIRPQFEKPFKNLEEC